MQNCANMISGVNRPYIYDPAGRRLTDVPKSSLRQLRKSRNFIANTAFSFTPNRFFPSCFTTSVAQDGSPPRRFLSESWSPVYIACVMAPHPIRNAVVGEPDLRFHSRLSRAHPGGYCPPLLLAYHMGVDCIYTEGLYWRGGGLVTFDGEAYTVTRLGKVAQWFDHDYVPAHPRHYSFRHVKPRVAVVRRPEHAGVRRTPSCLTRFSATEVADAAEAEAWLGLWHLLSNGTQGPTHPAM